MRIDYYFSKALIQAGLMLSWDHGMHFRNPEEMVPLLNIPWMCHPMGIFNSADSRKEFTNLEINFEVLDMKTPRKIVL